MNLKQRAFLSDESEIVLSHDPDINFTEIYRHLRTSQHS